MDLHCIISSHDMVIIIDLQCIGVRIWLGWIKSVTGPIWAYLSFPLYQTEKFTNYFTYHLLLASYFGGYSVAPGNITLLSILYENFTLPFNLPEILAWVTLVTFFLDLEATTLFGVLHRALLIPGLVEQKASFSLFFGKNPRSTLLTVLLNAQVVSKNKK